MSTEVMAKGVKVETRQEAGFEGLDILAAIASRELRIEQQQHGGRFDETSSQSISTVPPTSRMSIAAAAAANDRLSSEEAQRTAGGGGGRSAQPRKLAEMELLNLKQISAMSGNTLVRIFAEANFDEIKRTFSYTCILMPTACRAKFQSFGNESKAKKQIRCHLEQHVTELTTSRAADFTAEPLAARHKRLQDMAAAFVRPAHNQLLQHKQQQQQQQHQQRLQLEQQQPSHRQTSGVNNKRRMQPPPIKSEPSGGVTNMVTAADLTEKENKNSEAAAEVLVGLGVEAKRRRKAAEKEQHKQPSEALTAAESARGGRYIKKEHGKEEQQVGEEGDLSSSSSSSKSRSSSTSSRSSLDSESQMRLVGAFIKREAASWEREAAGGADKEAASTDKESVRHSIDEDHCYASRPVRFKAEKTEEGVRAAAAKRLSTQEEEEVLANIEAIQLCEVIIEGTFVDLATFQEEYIVEEEVESSETAVEVAVEAVPSPPAANSTQETVTSGPGGENPPVREMDFDMLYSEEVDETGGAAAGSGETENYDSKVFRGGKNKRTVAAVSAADRSAALSAMEELRSRGATTEDLVCRLCAPPRPFTAYSTLLTHYRSHAGLRPFECSICQATFTRQHSLKYHLMTHANKTRFTCPHCDRKFRHPTHYKEHVKKHGEAVQFSCHLCQASVSTQSQFRKHLKVRHNKTMDLMGNLIDWNHGEELDRDRQESRRRKGGREGQTSRRRKKRAGPKQEIAQEGQAVDSATATYFTKAEELESYVGPASNQQLMAASSQQLISAGCQQSSSNSPVVFVVPTTTSYLAYAGSPAVTMSIATVIESELLSVHHQQQQQQIQKQLQYQPHLMQQQQHLIQEQQHLQHHQHPLQPEQQHLVTSEAQLLQRQEHLIQPEQQQCQPQQHLIQSEPEQQQCQPQQHLIQPAEYSLQQHHSFIQAEQHTPHLLQPEQHQGLVLHTEDQGVEQRVQEHQLLLYEEQQEQEHMEQQQRPPVHPGVQLGQGQELRREDSAAREQPPKNAAPMDTTGYSCETILASQMNGDNFVVETGSKEGHPVVNQVVQSTLTTKAVGCNGSTILERALSEIFPTSASELGEGTSERRSLGGGEAVRVEKIEHTSQPAQWAQEADYELYEPHRSPLKNRNQVLCDILGIN